MKYLNFTAIAVIIGLMLAIQFQTIKEPVERDTRDTWQLQEDLLKEKEVYSKLLQEIRSNEEKLAKYETERNHSKELVLRETLEELKTQVGLTEVTGPGIILVIEQAYEDPSFGGDVPEISPESLQRLVNELNMNGAMYISIEGNRLINTSVIRDINGVTKVDGRSLKDFPIEIKVIAENKKNTEKLYNRMQASQAAEELYKFDSLRVNVSKPTNDITIPAYEDSIRIKNMEPVESEKGGSK
ncbi:DUF881 domain-containing protein [Bacillus marasmi]|uniref:DUF881 domain-containing protein n=1 Tax=Bacillus marasmi TaxID=1926279 RepID=UPI00164E7A76|nr:DUF881 domain-containing protein [Bacillus marasmi]